MNVRICTLSINIVHNVNTKEYDPFKFGSIQVVLCIPNVEGVRDLYGPHTRATVKFIDESGKVALKLPGKFRVDQEFFKTDAKYYVVIEFRQGNIGKSTFFLQLNTFNFITVLLYTLKNTKCIDNTVFRLKLKLL
ncbi:hypothetical protein Glove_51g53 [Diversispora epigaea]|uniref:Uncharacterized protein n=1 Tax=Diversispora epigaea TaxID=1348612 RepID=A0A397JNB9_9GLOM|nr:hypothetical protein Glove_51g53 [Diversispora epigaea]